MEPFDLRNEPYILTPIEVASILRIGKNTVYSLIKNGELGCVRIGRKILVPKDEIVRYIEQSVCYTDNSNSGLKKSVIRKESKLYDRQTTRKKR